jgi:hypothetical protein
MDASFARQTWLFLAAGLHARMPFLPDVSFPTLETLWGGGALARAVVLGAIPLLTAAGLARALRGPGPERFVWIGLAAAVPLALLHRALHDFLLLERFVIYGLAALVPLVAIGLDGALERVSPARARRFFVPAGLALGVVAYQAFVAPQTRVLLGLPQTPSREVADFLARAGEGAPGGALRAGVGLGADVPAIYDPWISSVGTREEIAALCARALAEERPLYVFYGYNHMNRTRRYGGAFSLLDDPRYFEEAARFDAIESEFVYRVLRYTGAPLEGGG